MPTLKKERSWKIHNITLHYKEMKKKKRENKLSLKLVEGREITKIGAGNKQN